MPNSSVFDTTYGEQNLYSGYAGALMLVLLPTAYAISGGFHEIGGFLIEKRERLLLMIALAFLVMLLAEAYGRRRYIQKGFISARQKDRTPPNSYLFKSSLYRFFALLFMFMPMYWIVQNHYYFDRSSGFAMTQVFFDYLLAIYLFLGIPYVFFTLKFRWSRQYEYNDYGILILIGLKWTLTGIKQALLHKKTPGRRWQTFVFNRRIRKVLLVYAVTFFFLTLMVKFFQNEFNQFERSFASVYHGGSFTFDNVYGTLYHLIFLVDVGLAIIGYTVSSRWLDNRVRSVDTTFGGWLAALLCYPPMNSGFTGQFLGYNTISHTPVITSEPLLMAIDIVILGLFTIYVWGTIALGFKFSNLTHRGIVTTGPYRFVRHPAYATKNVAWWFEATYVFSNIWACLALAGWNIIYILRGLTEERHLKKDPKYRAYCKKVKYRFIPGII